MYILGLNLINDGVIFLFLGKYICNVLIELGKMVYFG